MPFPLGLECPGSLCYLCTWAWRYLVKTAGGRRAKPQGWSLSFCGFQPDPKCYFRATSVFNLRMCVDQKEGPTHYFFFPLAK